MLPMLRMNRSFVEALLAERAPCFAMGLVAEGQTRYACLTLRPVDDIPQDLTRGGFNFGHSVRGTDDFEVVHFGFEFYGYRIFNALINPGNAIARTILSHMIETKAFFFFAVNPSGGVTAFKADIGECSLDGIVSNIERIMRSTRTDAQYDAALTAFSDNPDPVGPMLHWVCRDCQDGLDLFNNLIELRPA
ncbi:hypothetical protein [Paraburkholderia sp. JPY419]|uniref:hypothetical protein n=1 Tax=Paraburkholderia sp. JPY419 TaxID=667660 RepID=UPI003D227EEF